ncbi:serine/threonine protein kinase [Minicystis rosea]|nr:serine/threonine protein kinase [Minicystis rosea]
MRTDDFDDACAFCSPKGSADVKHGERLAGRVVVGRTADGHAMEVRIERTLAEGGIGVVHAGRAPDGRAVAVKVLMERHAHDAGIVSRFEREIVHALRIRHDNVVTALAAGRLDDGRPFLVMELLQGETLGAMVRSHGPVTIARGLRLGAQILAGLEAVHQAGLVHRDLSPDNVFIARDASGERAVILDLGFAQEPGVDTGDGVTADSPGSLVGTLAFMAPEQATRGRAVTMQSDLFAVALLVYYALSGRVPFRGQDDRDVIVSVVRAAPVPLRRVRRDAPVALDRVLGRALAKHPDARFNGAGEMRAALDRVPHDVRGAARASFGMPRARKASPRAVAPAA